MELRLTFGVANDEYDGAAVDVERIAGFTSADVDALQDELLRQGLGGAVHIEPGSIGKGAAGPGVQLVVEIGERVLNDGASVLAWGGALWALVRKVGRSRKLRRLTVQQPEAIGALALAAAPRTPGGLQGSHIGHSVCLTGGGPAMGTDSRDLWATPVTLEFGDIWVLFSSPSGLVLGDVTVPLEWSPHRGQIQQRDVPRVFSALNDWRNEIDPGG